MGRRKIATIPWEPEDQTIGGSTSPGNVFVNINWSNPNTTYGVLINIYADTSPFPGTLISTVFVAAGLTNYTANIAIGSPPTFVRAELNYQPSLSVSIPSSAVVVAGPTAI